MGRLAGLQQPHPNGRLQRAPSDREEPVGIQKLCVGHVAPARTSAGIPSHVHHSQQPCELHQALCAQVPPAGLQASSEAQLPRAGREQLSSSLPAELLPKLTEAKSTAGSSPPAWGSPVLPPIHLCCPQCHLLTPTILTNRPHHPSGKRLLLPRGDWRACFLNTKPSPRHVEILQKGIYRT